MSTTSRAGINVIFCALLTGVGAAHALAQTNMGFSAYIPARDEPCIDNDDRAAIQAAIQASIGNLKQRGVLPQAKSSVSVKFGWPLRAATNLTDFSFFGISNFVDQNTNYPNLVLDYNCGSRTYDTAAGYNHSGTDIFLWPYPWLKMDSNQVEIVAAADGTIVFKQDGNFDRSCAMNNNNWNAVYVQHSDGSIAWYGHMKSNSLTSKIVGATVTNGEFLGVVGSSGSSTGPHLHFEVYDSSNHLADPFQGACNSLNTNSLWEVQPPYYDSAINKVSTHWTPVSTPACPGQEIPNERDVFQQSDTIYFFTFYRDQLSGQTSQYYVVRPDASVWASWTHSSPTPYYAASYWYWYYTLGSAEQRGAWTFRVVYQGKTNEHAFYVGTADAALRMTSSVSTVKGGSNFTYSIVVSNVSPTTATYVAVSDPLPVASAAFVSAVPAYTMTNGTINWSFGSMTAGAVSQAQVVLKFTNMTAITAITNTATVSMGTYDTNSANNATSVVVLTDQDGDGIPTLFENPAIDIDHDGIPSYLDTDETFDMAAMNSAGSNVWSSISGAVYQVQYLGSLLSGTWTDFGGPLTARNSSLVITDTNSTTTQRYYRVILQQLPP